MKDQLIAILETFCPERVFLQGTYDPDQAYPDDFITFWTDETDDVSFYDDQTMSVSWQYSVFYYSNDPEKVNSVPQEIKNALKAGGFLPQGAGHDIPSSVSTHTGWMTKYIYIQYQ